VSVPVELSLGELAVRFGLKLNGDPSLKVYRVATLANARDGCLSFFANSRYRRQLATTQATAVVLNEADAAECPAAALIDRNPYLTYARISALLHPQPVIEPGIHPSAVVAPGARVAASASVGPLCVIEDDAEIGERVLIGPGCVVQRGARVGADSRLISQVNLYHGVTIGQRCILHAGAVIGADGFGFAPDGGAWVKVPQVGSVRIGDDVEVGASTTIDRGAVEDTVVENGVILDNQIQIGHNVVLGEHTAIAACSGISGSTVLGKRVQVGGMVGISGHLHIADDVQILGCSLVSASIKKAGTYSSSMPVVEARRWRRMVAVLRRMADKER
jgi:UDP-3-O-[3-hydroxymyristoyl] glucosamine N-acyltransferase